MEINELFRKTLSSVVPDKDGTEEILFTTIDGDIYKLYHSQDCCESVWLDDICGDLEDLVGAPIIIAEERTQCANGDNCESGTWTFYHLATRKGHVTLTWKGESNGYYSESVSFRKEEG